MMLNVLLLSKCYQIKESFFTLFKTYLLPFKIFILQYYSLIIWFNFLSLTYPFMVLLEIYHIKPDLAVKFRLWKIYKKVMQCAYDVIQYPTNPGGILLTLSTYFIDNVSYDKTCRNKVLFSNICGKCINYVCLKICIFFVDIITAQKLNMARCLEINIHAPSMN